MLGLAILLPVLPIIYEDFRYRAIHWIWVLLLSLAILYGYPFRWPLVAINFFFIFIQIAALTLYFSIKQGQLINITKQYLGIGDIVFFIPLCLFFPPVHLILFFVGSLLLTLLGYFFWQFFTSPKTATIPLAGCMSLVLILVQLIAFWWGFDLREDWWIRGWGNI